MSLLSAVANSEWLCMVNTMLAKIKTWSSYTHTHTPQSYSCIYDCHMQDRPKLWWRLRPNHLVSYSTLQDPIILSLTQPYKTRSSCLLLNLTRPDHLLFYSTLQDPIILSLTQPYKTWSSFILLNLTRPDHLVSYSTLQDLIILSLNLTKPYHLVSYSMWPDQHAIIMLIVNMLEQSIWMIV